MTSGRAAGQTRATCSTTATSTTRCAPIPRSPPAGKSPASRPTSGWPFYCGTGWRASEAWFCALLMGWQRISVYDGGWLEWAQDPSNPIEVGEQSGSS
jgi:Rhodanese-like domain